MLIKESIKKENEITYNYIDSITSLNKEGKHDSHIALNNVELEKGVYYICCDVNSRFLNINKKIHGYVLNIFSESEIEVENVTNKINGVKIFQESIINFITNIKKKKDDKEFKYEKRKTFNTLKKKLKSEYFKNNLKEETKRDFKILKFKDRELFPFDIYYFKNKSDEEQEKILKFDIDKNKKDMCIYNDNQYSEFDRFIIKRIRHKNKEIILTMKYSYELNKKEYVFYNELEGNYKHPVFLKGVKEAIKGKLHDKIICYSLNASNGLGKFLGIENITKSDIKLSLKVKNGFIINPRFWGRDYLPFTILSKKNITIALKAETDDKTGKPISIEYSIEPLKK